MSDTGNRLRKEWSRERKRDGDKGMTKGGEVGGGGGIQILQSWVVQGIYMI